MTIRWLSQVTTIGLQRDHVYRARYLVTNPFSFATTCSSLPPGPIIQALLNMPGTGTAFPADLQVFTSPPSGWPPARSGAVPSATGECTVWAQMRAASDFLLPVGTIEQALAPVSGRLIDFWDVTDDIVLVDNQVGTPAPVPSPPPPVPPPAPPAPPGTTPQPPPTPMPPPPKAKKKASEIVIPWSIGIAVVFGLIRAFRKA